MAAKSQGGAATAEVVTQETSLLDEIVSATSFNPEDETYTLAKEGLKAFIQELAAGNRQEVKVSGPLVDELIKEIDRKISKQMDAIIHNEDFQKLESTWRSLKFLIDRTDFRENNRINIMNISKDDLLSDFDDAPEITKSGLYKQIYTAEYGQFGGQPFGGIIANYEFGPGAPDIKLLGYAAAVATMSHAPFIASAGPKFFGVERWAMLPNLKDLKSIFEQPVYAKWQSFRTSEDARNVCLTLPKFLLRLPYSEDNPTKTFNYEETVQDPDIDFCWGNTAFALASKLTDSFAKYRWCANIIGPQGGGSVDDLPLYRYEEKGETHNKIPTQVLISERREFELAEEGFCALTMRKGSDNASFFSANSCLKAKVFANTPEGKEAETNYKLSLQLPYMMIMSRLAHYIKVLQRENIGTWKERADLERELTEWIRQYVTEMDNPAAEVRSRRPLRMASIEVSDVEGDPGWYRVSLKVRPHFKYMGANFTLSLVGKLDKK
ncbi:MAG: type VI secretion system contractile sheath large subunit [Deltaproteobacteria bacterium]|jgi:type VI secretion system protein ImpC|nr:type VI secretion system contractile sheath large subunit [Deltaproteobacteria bacterium]